MKAIYKLLLWLVTAALPVVIAACYGVYYRYSKSGRVVDAQTGQGVPAIELSCADQPAPLAVMDITAEDGSFFMGFEIDCATLRLRDADGAENGGYYGERTSPLPPGDAQGVVVEIEPFENVAQGQVVAADDGLGIANIQVTCLDAAGEALSQSRSLESGTFYVGYQEPCATLRLEDVDGDQLGSFEAREVPFDPAAETLVVELERAPGTAALDAGSED